MSGNSLSCIEGVKDPFEAQEGRWDFSRDAAVEKGLNSCRGENLLVFLELRQQTWGSSQPTMGTSGTRSCCLRKASLHVSCDELYGIPLLSVQDPRSSFGAEAGTLGFLSSADMDLGVTLEFPQGIQA